MLNSVLKLKSQKDESLKIITLHQKIVREDKIQIYLKNKQIFKYIEIGKE